MTSFHIRGTVDDDELLSLQFGDNIHEPMPQQLENLYCDVFRSGEMAVRLIETFSKGNRPVDFELEVTQLSETVIVSATADGWPLDPEWVAKQLGLGEQSALSPPR